MCLIVFAWRPTHRQPLIVAANRDEFYARPTQPMTEWHDAPGVYAGRDLEAGGTWLGIGNHGRFAALTNIRDPNHPPGRRSRGELVARFLTGEQPIEDYLAEVVACAGEYGGFNLLLGTADSLFFLSAVSAQPQLLKAGVYGLSNAGLDTPWPKLLKAKAALLAELDDPQVSALLGLLRDPDIAPEAGLPDTGVGRVTESLLSSVFISSPNYGTRASSALIVNADGSRHFAEHSFGPYGGHLGTVELIV
ncbi:NRDE family protein [Pseudomonas sp. 10B1]|uniref:NRDE family protein n=1 Tax=unclassified Pseudomonas TaxID=196821 RepID=UPI002AB58EED|nr:MULTISPECIES: NRDE family protein [unclassified Pseudomonas]MDY7562924.1 NRDE family protein [Pseudomonas sp. AB6]MEA9995489.1 NRDE family protein [Pseudomonas sp. AA4]MEB0085333.1 NRDE family protein [Pseudomonas sp. RTI1]MEB0125436.1 NRDE family protein [Pseudomonas sp. CCC1.2]MEB0153171.1 NRDE family protein [Pseudomonas sp. CCC4.3]